MLNKLSYLFTSLGFAQREVAHSFDAHLPCVYNLHLETRNKSRFALARWIRDDQDDRDRNIVDLRYRRQGLTELNNQEDSSPATGRLKLEVMLRSAFASLARKPLAQPASSQIANRLLDMPSAQERFAAGSNMSIPLVQHYAELHTTAILERARQMTRRRKRKIALRNKIKKEIELKKNPKPIPYKVELMLKRKGLWGTPPPLR